MTASRKKGENRGEGKERGEEFGKAPRKMLVSF